MENEFQFLLGRLAINGLSRSTIVLKLLETVPVSDKFLLWFKDFVREQHIRLALDGFGRGESNLERYHLVMPDVVKIDNRLFAQSMNYARKKRLLVSFISRIHDDGGKVVIEGLETEEMLVYARELCADLFQGSFLDSPDLPMVDFFQLSRPNLSHAAH